MQKKITYNAKGKVLGKLWGGGVGSYRAMEFSVYHNLKKLKATIRKELKTGGLDYGMGFEKLLGAYMKIETQTVLEIEGKEYTNITSEFEIFGKLTPDQENHLIYN